MVNQQNIRKPDQNSIKPSRGWYVFALILFIVGITGGIIILFTAIFSSLTEGTQFLVPGEIVVLIEKPGKYILYNETSTIFRGKLYTSSSELPENLEIGIYEVPSGDVLELSPAWAGKETFGSTERYSIGSIRFEKAGEYRIEVRGDFSERVLLLRRSICKEILGAFVLFSLLSILGWVAAPVIAIVVLVKRSSEKRKLEPKPMVQKPEVSDEGAKRIVIEDPKARMWATFCHLGAFAGYLFPFANVIVPLVIWLVKKDESSLIDDQGKESLNFQISMTIYYIISFILILAIVGILLLIGLSVFNLIAVIIAAVKSNNGERYRYPLCIRFIK